MFPTAQQLRTHPTRAIFLIWAYNDAHDAKCVPTLDGVDKSKAETTRLGSSTRLTGLRSSTKQPVFSSVFATDEGPSYGQTCNLWRSPSSPFCLRPGGGLAPWVPHNGGMISSEPLVPNKPFFPQAASCYYILVSIRLCFGVSPSITAFGDWTEPSVLVLQALLPTETSHWPLCYFFIEIWSQQ